ncbi:methyl-accepting chemotaxis protein [Paenibacillus kribbensis]|uniref:methyl-accepting chemotaxis protein n=1 Tax=Paenibacillus kribbensis TaxID=172713 RepID=UPI002DBDDBD3|nr:methyl-accepting chemotaxis protein [Paenibacillus kribbensis]MEC0233673.1 methyl-accepting chemotaxis protein [Paenibacillus kribbensis]
MITEPKTQSSSTAVIERDTYKPITTYVPCREVPIIGTDMSCKELLALMKTQEEIPCVIVVDKNELPLGIIMRDAYNRHFTGRFAAALFYDKPAAIFADPNTLIVDLKSPASDIVELAMLREDQRFYDCLLLKEGTRLLGVLTIRDILSVVQRMQKEADEHRGNVVQHSYDGVHRIQTTVKDAAKEADDSMRLTRTMSELSRRGKVELEDVLLSYRAVTEQMQRQHEQMTALTQSLNDIAGMASSIRALADHSGLLAINASIEAAHAGEHGRGFQIVSQEVRNMSLQTKVFSEQITSLLADIEQMLRDTVELTDTSLQQIHTGSQYISAGTQTFAKLLQAVTEIEAKNSQMSRSAEEAALNAAGIAQELELMLNP